MQLALSFSPGFPAISRTSGALSAFILAIIFDWFTPGHKETFVSSCFLAGDWIFGYVVCQFWLSVDYTASTASIFNLFILSLDRYWSITSPLRYLRRRTKKRALVMIALAWTGASMWVIPVLGWHHIIHGGVRQQPGKMDIEYVSKVTTDVNRHKKLLGPHIGACI